MKTGTALIIVIYDTRLFLFRSVQDDFICFYGVESLKKGCSNTIQWLRLKIRILSLT